MMQHAEGYQLRPESDGSGGQVKNIKPVQAWQMLQDKKAVLVDVRTEQELPDDGQPNITETGGESVLIPWRIAPDFQANPHFIEQLKEQFSSEVALMFLCKAGGRSAEAAQVASAEGFAECYNVLGGMDGEEGWKASGLAWRVA